MPVYEFRCERCGKAFEEVQTFDEHARTTPVCPKCKSADQVERLFSTFTPVTTRKA